MQRTTDVVVVGLGATGSATLHQLARRGLRVVGIDAHHPPHDRGSSHGHTRIYRQAYYEAPEYVPLARRALELWHELERIAGRTLFVETGALTIGPEDGELFSGARRSAVMHGIPHEILAPDEVARRFPAFRTPDNAAAIFEPTGGVLFAEECVRAHLSAAKSRGATLLLGESVRVLRTVANGVRIITDAGSIDAPHVVVAAGPWTPQLLGLRASLRVTREYVHWFADPSESARAPACPVAMIDAGRGPILYSIGDFGDGFKAGLHHSGAVAGPDESGTDAADNAAQVARLVARFAPGGSGRLRQSVACHYTSTSDCHFAIGPIERMPGVLIASACSGHGFKFAPAVGEAVTSLVLRETPAIPLRLFDPERLSSS